MLTRSCMCRVGVEGGAGAAPWRAWQWGLELTHTAQPGDVLATMPARAALGMHPCGPGGLPGGAQGPGAPAWRDVWPGPGERGAGRT